MYDIFVINRIDKKYFIHGGNVMKKFMIRTEIYSRVAGYFRPVNQWNNGKKEEFIERRVYSIRESLNRWDENIKSKYID